MSDPKTEQSAMSMSAMNIPDKAVIDELASAKNALSGWIKAFRERKPDEVVNLIQFRDELYLCSTKLEALGNLAVRTLAERAKQ